MYGSCRRQCCHVRQGAVHQHSDEHQLFGVSAEEELAECAVPVHQEQHGQALQAVLDYHTVRDVHCCVTLVWTCSLHNKYTKGQLLLQSPQSLIPKGGSAWVWQLAFWEPPLQERLLMRAIL